MELRYFSKTRFGLGIWVLKIGSDKSFKAMPLYSSMSMSNDNRNNNANQREANCSIVGFRGKEANCHISKQLVIDGCVNQIYPIYDLYVASQDGKIIHIIKQLPPNGSKQRTGYWQCTVRKYGDKNHKTYFVHRFVWECFYGMIPDEKVIDL